MERYELETEEKLYFNSRGARRDSTLSPNCWLCGAITFSIGKVLGSTIGHDTTTQPAGNFCTRRSGSYAYLAEDATIFPRAPIDIPPSHMHLIPLLIVKNRSSMA